MRDIRSGFYTKAPVSKCLCPPLLVWKSGGHWERVEAFLVELEVETTKRSPHSTLVDHSEGVSSVFKFFWNPQLCAKQPNLKEISQRVASPYINSFFKINNFSHNKKRTHIDMC